MLGRRGGDKIKSTHRRRAKKYGAAGTFDKWDVMIRLGKQKNRCHYCLDQLITHGAGKFQIDHFIPLSRGGSNYANNLVIACPDCNRDKSNKMPWEYRPARFEEGCGRDG
jgi:5-methylcytosine-specific restriction endonuclease McrA